MKQMTDDPLAEFKHFIEQTGFWGKLSCTVPLGAPLLPTVISLFSSGPLWPDNSLLISSIVSVFSYIMEITIYVLWFQKHHWAKARLNSWLVFFASFSILLLCLFIYLIYHFNYPAYGVGFTEKAQRFAKMHPDKNVFEILNDFGNEEEKVFTPGFLKQMRLGALFLWLLFWGCFTSFSTIFVILQRKKHAEQEHKQNK